MTPACLQHQAAEISNGGKLALASSINRRSGQVISAFARLAASFFAVFAMLTTQWYREKVEIVYS
jgi:hypothetical protein